MTFESRPTDRADNPTTIAAARYFGIITVRRGTVPTTGGTVTIPSKVRYFYIKNAHSSNSFAINFNSDDATDYWLLEPKEITPMLQITESTNVNAKAIGGNSTYEAIFIG